MSDRKRKPTDSVLVEETETMERKRRAVEKSGHRSHLKIKVHEPEHHEKEARSAAPEGELQNDILQNPWLDSQRFDGIPPDMNPAPPLNTDARREFDNEKREQQLQLQKRLGLDSPSPAFSPKPRPGGA